MNNDVKSIENIMKQAAGEDCETQMTPDWKALQAEAKQFLSWSASFSKSKIQTQQRQSIASINEIYGYKRFSSNRIKAAEESKKFYRALFKFDQAMTRYLGEKPKRALFVIFDSKGNPKTYDMSLEQLASMSYGRGRLGTSLNMTDLIAIEDQVDKETEDYKEHIQQGAAAAMGVNNRLQCFYDQRPKGQSQAQGGLLMWKIAGVWQIAKIANQGVVAEAYSNFLLTKHKTKQDYLAGVETGQPNYYSHSLIAKFYKYLSAVTNNPAVVEEDIYTEWAQYAVKGKKAGLPSPKQYIRTAYTILTSSSEIAPAQLKKMIVDAFQKHSQLAPFIGTSLDDNCEKVANELIKSLGI